MKCVSATRSILKTAAMIMAAVLLRTGDSEAAVSPDSGCIRWRDSLVVAGMRSLDSNRINDAKRFFTGAFMCGMRKDSMHYYIAELYLRQMRLDTALVFNKAAAEANTLSAALWIVQRAKIFWFLGKKTEADSLMALVEKRQRHEFSYNVYGVRNVTRLNDFSLLPQLKPLSFDPDTDDIGMQSMNYCFSYRKRNSLPWQLQFSVSSPTPMPTRHFLDESYDTLQQLFTISGGAGTLAETPSGSAGVKLRVTPDGLRHWHLFERFSTPLINRNLYTLSSDTRFDTAGYLDDGRIDASFFRFIPGTKISQSISFQCSYHFSQSNIYQNHLGSTGIYPPLPKAFVRFTSTTELDPAIPMTYYKDAACSTAFGPIPRNEWNSQPKEFIMTAPRHDLGTGGKYSFSYKPLQKWSISLNGHYQLLWYPEKVTWYAASKKIAYIQPDDCALLYNVADSSFYLTTDRKELNYHPDKFFRLSYHEKTRLDSYFIVSSSIERAFRDYGTTYFTVSFTKGFSTFSRKDPMVTFDYAWECALGWKKEISVQR